MQAVRASQNPNLLCAQPANHAEDEQTEGVHRDGRRQEVARSAAGGGVKSLSIQAAKLMGGQRPMAGQSQWPGKANGCKPGYRPGEHAGEAGPCEESRGRGHLDYTEEDRTERVREATDGDGADDILEMVGGDFPQKPPVS